MPAKITIGNIANPENETELRRALVEYFHQVQGRWEVDIVGAQQNSTWQFTVVAPNGCEAVYMNNNHDIEGTILAEVRQIVQRLSVSDS